MGARPIPRLKPPDVTFDPGALARTRVDSHGQSKHRAGIGPRQERWRVSSGSSTAH